MPCLRALPLHAKWGPIVLQQQRAFLVDHVGQRAQAALEDEGAAEMFAWFWITGAVHLMAGIMAIPMLWYGYHSIGSIGHLLFFTATWLKLGWCLFDAIDGTQRYYCSGRMSTSLSGMASPCSRRWWAATVLMHHPFWFALVLPMNAMLADLPGYHMIFSVTVFGSGLQFISR